MNSKLILNIKKALNDLTEPIKAKQRTLRALEDVVHRDNSEPSVLRAEHEEYKDKFLKTHKGMTAEMRQDHDAQIQAQECAAAEAPAREIKGQKRAVTANRQSLI